jgi:FPC/CPF motif-containing protein YcgG
MRPKNPFDSPQALAHSSYARLEGSRLVGLPGRGEPSALQRFVHESLRAVVLSSSYPCFGAQAALRSGRYAMGLYEGLGCHGASEGLARDLFEFKLQQDAWAPHLSTFLACFESPVALDEPAFEEALWGQLQVLHELDRPHHAWDPEVSDDPANPHFSFSFAERAYFIVGLHAANSRWSRRFAWPALVFNAHRQFERLRIRHQLATLQRHIRERDEELQGTLNPNLADFGLASEARQYSGRAVEPSWLCPFRPQPDEIGESA